MIFLLGGNGFVGSAFTRYCVAHGLEHRVIQRDNYQAHVGRECELLINANGNSRKFLAQTEPLAEFDASVRSVRASLSDFPAKRYVHLSSCDVYPDCSSPASTAEDERIDPRRQSPYGFHKYLAEQCVRHGARSWLICRLGGLVGPGIKKNPIFDILQGGPLWLDPASELQYLNTDDCARLIFQLIERGLEGQAINVCGRGVIRLSEMIDHVGSPVEVKPGSPRVRYDVAISRLTSLVSVPETRETVRAFIQTMLGSRQ